MRSWKWSRLLVQAQPLLLLLPMPVPCPRRNAYVLRGGLSSLRDAVRMCTSSLTSEVSYLQRAFVGPASLFVHTVLNLCSSVFFFFFCPFVVALSSLFNCSCGRCLTVSKSGPPFAQICHAIRHYTMRFPLIDSCLLSSNPSSCNSFISPFFHLKSLYSQSPVFASPACLLCLFLLLFCFCFFSVSQSCSHLQWPFRSIFCYFALHVLVSHLLITSCWDCSLYCCLLLLFRFLLRCSTAPSYSSSVLLDVPQYCSPATLPGVLLVCAVSLTCGVVPWCCFSWCCSCISPVRSVSRFVSSPDVSCSAKGATKYHYQTFPSGNRVLLSR